MEKLKLYGSLSYCHQRPSIIVRSMEGGFVTQNCTQCGNKRTLPFDELPDLICGECEKDLIPFINNDQNYAYKCSSCETTYILADLVPWWYEIFP